ncbi:MAG TPA: hypothetical protein PLY86_22455 [bacterium]|nr:hypothetical protein [bacterium]
MVKTQMDIETYMENTLRELETLYHQMANRIESPVLCDIGGYGGFRYPTQSAALACFLKGIKIVSSLNAWMILLRAGYVQEIGALCRMIDDYYNEILFLYKPQDGNELSKDQKQFLDDFFKEELDKPMDPLGSSQKRTNVPVKKIHATFGKIVESELNPSDAQEMLRTSHQINSGYVHGAYPHIMELFGGNPPHFHLTGMLRTPRIDEWTSRMVDHICGALMVSIGVAEKLGLQDIKEDILRLKRKFETDMNLVSPKTPARMLDEMKRKS